MTDFIGLLPFDEAEPNENRYGQNSRLAALCRQVNLKPAEQEAVVRRRNGHEQLGRGHEVIAILEADPVANYVIWLEQTGHLVESGDGQKPFAVLGTNERDRVGRAS